MGSYLFLEQVYLLLEQAVRESMENAKLLVPGTSLFASGTSSEESMENAKVLVPGTSLVAPGTSNEGEHKKKQVTLNFPCSSSLLVPGTSNYFRGKGSSV